MGELSGCVSGSQSLWTTLSMPYPESYDPSRSCWLADTKFIANPPSPTTAITYRTNSSSSIDFVTVRSSMHTTRCVRDLTG